MSKYLLFKTSVLDLKSKSSVSISPVTKSPVSKPPNRLTISNNISNTYDIIESSYETGLFF